MTSNPLDSDPYLEHRKYVEDEAGKGKDIHWGAGDEDAYLVEDLKNTFQVQSIVNRYRQHMQAEVLGDKLQFNKTWAQVNRTWYHLYWLFLEKPKPLSQSKKMSWTWDHSVALLHSTSSKPWKLS